MPPVARFLQPGSSRTASLVRWIQGSLVVALVIFLLDRYRRCGPYICTPGQPLHLDLELDGYPAYRAHLEAIRPTRGVSTADRALVLASTAAEDTAWVDRHFPDWQRAVYITDDPTAEYSVPANRGHESIAYLSYIIEHYDSLPSIMVFNHAQRFQWHNDDPKWDGVSIINNLRHEHVQQQGYANLRCAWDPGCPIGHTPAKTSSWYGSLFWPNDPKYNTEASYAQAWLELFPDKSPSQVPENVGTQCCAQFAMSRDAILSVPLDRWKYIRAWVLATKLPDEISGRIMEYAWHQFVGKPPVYCPSAQKCYCETFGVCNLTCSSDGQCDKRWLYPGVWHFPPTWPDGEPTWFNWPDANWAEDRR